MSFQKEYENYLAHSSHMDSSELLHYGVPGMKWGVRKSTYSKLNKYQKRALRSYAQTEALGQSARKASKNRIKSVGNFAKDYKIGFLKTAAKRAQSRNEKKINPKEQAKIKKLLEKSIGESINDESAKSSARASLIKTSILGGPLMTAAKTGLRMKRVSNLKNMDKEWIDAYLKGINQTKIREKELKRKK